MAVTKYKGDVFSLQVDSTGGSSFVDVAGLSNSVTFSSDSENVEVWGLGDTIKENMPSAINPGQTTADIFFTAADTQHKTLVGLYHNRTIANWRVYNNTTSAVHRGPFLGYISAWSDNVTKGEVYTATITIMHTEATGLNAS